MFEARRLKVKNGLKGFIPEVTNFHDLKFEEDEGFEFDPGDNGMAVEKFEQDIEYEKLILQILMSLNKQEKLIFVFQLLRDYGYQIDHGLFARTIGMTRAKYMEVLKLVRMKTFLMIEGHSVLHNHTNEG